MCLSSREMTFAVIWRYTKKTELNWVDWIESISSWSLLNIWKPNVPKDALFGYFWLIAAASRINFETRVNLVLEAWIFQAWTMWLYHLGSVLLFSLRLIQPSPCSWSFSEEWAFNSDISFKPKKAPNSRNEPSLRSQVTENLAKSQC